MKHSGLSARRLGIVGMLSVAAMLLTSCSAEEAMRFGWPAGVTPEAKDMLHFWQWVVIAALIMGIIVWGLIFWTITFHRRRSSHVEEFPRQTAYNDSLELGYTIVPLIAVAILFYFTVVVQNKVEAKAANPSVVVDVTAFKWNWKFGYRTVKLANGEVYNGFEGYGKPFDVQHPGKKDHEGEELPGPAGGRQAEILKYLAFNKIETLGTPDEIPVLVLPTGRRIEFQIAATDVIHSFWVPEFLFKRDVMPFPKENKSDNRFQISEITKEGAFVGRCAELCGEFHSMMNFEVRAVSPAKFEQYLKFRRENPEATNGQALSSIGESPVSITTKPFDAKRGERSPAK